MPPDFIPNPLEVRLAIAPAYTCAAVERDAGGITRCLEEALGLEDTPEAFAANDWKLHCTLTVSSGNPVYTLILNGFNGFYEQMARMYFAQPDARLSSRAYYAALLEAARQGHAAEAGAICRKVMVESISIWKRGPTRG